MSKKTGTGTTREDRLKQALKANLARRKQQAKARDRAEEADSENEDEGSDG